MIKKRLSALFMAVILLASVIISDCTCIPVYAGGTLDKYLIGKDIVNTIVSSIWKGFKGGASPGLQFADEMWEKMKEMYGEFFDTGNDAIDGSKPDAPIQYSQEDDTYIITQNFNTFVTGYLKDYIHRLDGYYLIEQNATFSEWIVQAYNASDVKDKEPDYNKFYQSFMSRVTPGAANFFLSSVSLHAMEVNLSASYIYNDYIVNLALDTDRQYFLGAGAYLGGTWGTLYYDYYGAMVYINDILDGKISYCGSPLMIFYNKTAYDNYMSQGKTYIPQINFNHGPVKVHLPDLPDLFPDLTIDTGGLSEEEIQAKIDKAVQDVIDSLPTISEVDPTPTPINPTPTPTPPPSGGDVDLTEIVMLLKKIIADNGLNFNELITAIKENGVSGEIPANQLDEIIKLLTESNEKLDTVVDKLNAILLAINVNTAAGLLGDLFSRFKPLSEKAKQKFPTSIPWDVALTVGFLAHEPEVPKFELPLDLPHFGIKEVLTIDLSNFAKLSKVSRAILSLTFVLFLIVLTRNLFGKDD